jgi:hypothetical protein
MRICIHVNCIQQLISRNGQSCVLLKWRAFHRDLAQGPHCCRRTVERNNISSPEKRIFSFALILSLGEPYYCAQTNQIGLLLFLSFNRTLMGQTNRLSLFPGGLIAAMVSRSAEGRKSARGGRLGRADEDIAF